jgi:tRNA pseudouridine55 synthase
MGMDGLICVHKDRALTSHDVVQEIRKALQARKAGHCGTLDPMATGVLLITLGKATKFFPYLSKQDKTYRGRIRLGFSTTTYDSEGEATSLESGLRPSLDQVEAAMGRLEGAIRQAPPPFSAKKFKGKPLYKLSREKKPVPLRPSPVVVHSFRLLEYAPPYIDFLALCGSGTYVRSLAHDLGSALGCGAHLVELVRQGVGPYTLDDCHGVSDIVDAAENGHPERFIIPIESLLPEFPRVVLSRTGEEYVRHGRPIPPSEMDGIPARSSPGEGIVRLFSAAGKLQALARISAGKDDLFPFLVLV